MRVVLAAAILLLLSVDALGHDHWISHGKYRDPVTRHDCCGEHDCIPVNADRVRVTPAGYHLLDFNEVIPFARAIPSERDDDGVFRYYRCKYYQDTLTRCFFTPLGGV